MDIERLRRAARAKGDDTDYAIHKRTGLSLSTISRLVNDQNEPSGRSLRLFKKHYEVSADELLADAPSAAV